MKLKASEAVFLLVCLAAAIAAIASVYIFRDGQTGDMKTNFVETEAIEKYDVSVINCASVEDFTEVSGIGEVKAGDIVAYREAIGGFRRTEQLKDVSGISETLYQRIIEHFYLLPKSNTTAQSNVTETDMEETAVTSNDVTTPSQTAVKVPESAVTEAVTTITESAKNIRMVNINAASAEEIADALLVDIELADEIIALREKIGRISTVQELYEFCDGIDGDTYRRVKDYIVFD